MLSYISLHPGSPFFWDEPPFCFPTRHNVVQRSCVWDLLTPKQAPDPLLLNRRKRKLLELLIDPFPVPCYGHPASFLFLVPFFFSADGRGKERTKAEGCPLRVFCSPRTSSLQREESRWHHTTPHHTHGVCVRACGCVTSCSQTQKPGDGRSPFPFRSEQREGRHSSFCRGTHRERAVFAPLFPFFPVTCLSSHAGMVVPRPVRTAVCQDPCGFFSFFFFFSSPFVFAPDWPFGNTEGSCLLSQDRLPRVRLTLARRRHPPQSSN